MTTAKDIAKKGAKGALCLTIGASYLAKHGLNFTSGLCKCFFGGAKNLTDQLVGGGLNLGIGSYLLEQTQKAVNWSADKLIKTQKNLKEKL